MDNASTARVNAYGVVSLPDTGLSHPRLSMDELDALQLQLRNHTPDSVDGDGDRHADGHPDAHDG